VPSQHPEYFWILLILMDLMEVTGRSGAPEKKLVLDRWVLNVNSSRQLPSQGMDLISTMHPCGFYAPWEVPGASL
jgi:hypothetical protein